jgi:hypothetical protein
MKPAPTKKPKQYMSDKAFGDLEQSLNQALKHAHGEKGGYQEKISYVVPDVCGLFVSIKINSIFS